MLSRQVPFGKTAVLFSCQLADKAGEETFTLPFSLSTLADYIATDRSAMMRELKRLREEGVVPVGRTAVYPLRRLRKSGFTKLLKSTLKIWQPDGENALTGIPGRVKISTMCHAEGYRSDRKQSFDHSGKKEQYVSYREKRGAPAHSHSI